VSDVVVVTDPEPDPDPAPEPPPADAAGDAASSAAEAVAAGIVGGVQAIATDHLAGTADLEAKVDQLTAAVAVLAAATLAEEPEPEPVVEIEPDEIEPVRSHPWFRSKDEWLNR
jgi:hypothetical protein